MTESLAIRFAARLASLTEGRTSLTFIGPLYTGGKIPAGPVVFIDGGARYRAAGRGASVGDGDSFDGELDFTLPTVKNFSDLAFALRAVPAGINVLRLLGFLGGRRDHELINLGETHAFLQPRAGTRVDLDQQVIGLSRGRFALDVHGTFSVIAFAPADVALTGACRYPLPRPTNLPAVSSLGLSNEGRGGITLTAGAPVFVLLNTGAPQS